MQGYQGKEGNWVGLVKISNANETETETDRTCSSVVTEWRAASDASTSHVRVMHGRTM